MANSIAQILWEASEATARWGMDYEGTRPELKASVDRGAHAVALYVLEIACPDSPILAAMKAGASFEVASKKWEMGDPRLRFRETLQNGVDPTEAPLSVRLAQHDKDAARIDEPTKAELAAAVGEIFGGLAEPWTPTARSGS